MNILANLEVMALLTICFAYVGELASYSCVKSSCGQGGRILVWVGGNVVSLEMGRIP